MNRKLAEAVERMFGGTMCWTAAITGPSQARASICPTVNSSQPSQSEGANRPIAKTGKASRKQKAGMRA